MQGTENLTALIKITLTVVSIGVIAATMAGFFGRLWWIFDLLSHFRVHYFVLAVVVALGLYLVGARKSALILSAFGMLNFVLMAPFFVPRARAANPGETYRLLSANVLTSNLKHHLVRDLIIGEEPDFVMLAEVNQPWLDDLALDESGYLYSELYPRDNNFGIAFFSRIPFDHAEIVDTIVPSVLVNFSLDGTDFNLIGTHTWPPLNAHLSEKRDEQMRKLAELVVSQSGAILFCGDLNLTSWSHAYLQFMGTTQMRDSRVGRGIQASWPASIPMMRIPIDHVFITQQIEILERRLGPDVGSDHLPVIVEFIINSE